MPLIFFSLILSSFQPYFIICHSFNDWSETSKECFLSFHTHFHISLPFLWDIIRCWWWNDLNDVGMREIFDGEDFDHPHPLFIPVIFGHCEMYFLSFDGHSNTEWPQNEGDDAGMTFSHPGMMVEWLEWGWNEEIFEVRQMP